LKLICFSAAAFAICVARDCAAAGAATSSMLAAAMESITADELYEHVEVLADDVYEGRAAGSRGGRAAAQYIVQQLRESPLEPAGDNGRFTQRFNGGWQNILAVHRGDDPELTSELIVVGAHFDHVGYGNRNNSYGPTGRIHNGADDNASGVAVVLEAIEAMSASALSTRRSILFAFWDGEENGLVGSRHWLAQPSLPEHRVKLAFTADMVGRMRDRRLYIFGSRTGFGMRRLLSGPMDNALSLDFTWELNSNSDHWSFLEKRIPTVMVHTGLHRDYHRPSDDVEKVNREGMREVSRYMLSAAIEAADAEALPEYRNAGRREHVGMQRSMERPLERRSLERWPANRPRPRLGIAWREDSAEPGSVIVTQVVEGTPADEAGLAVLDRIYELQERQFRDSAEFESNIHAVLNAEEPGFTLLVERRGDVRTVTVRMPAERQTSGAAAE
jgi:hypothetical protein